MKLNYLDASMRGFRTKFREKGDTFMKIIEWVDCWKSGTFMPKGKDSKSCVFDAVTQACWHDWFCNEEELLGKNEIEIGPLLSKIENNEILLKYDVKLYNCCPLSGNLYDEIVFIDSDNKDSISGGYITIGCPYEDKKYVFITYEDFDKADKEDIIRHKVFSFKTDDKEELIAYINRLDANMHVKNFA